MTAQPLLPVSDGLLLTMQLRRFRQCRRLELLAVVFGLLGLTACFLYNSYQQARQQASLHLQATAGQMASELGHSLASVDMLLRHIRHELVRTPRWSHWSARDGFDYLQQRHPPYLVQLRDLILFDTQGLQRFISTRYPAPDIRVADRRYFRELAAGKESTADGPFVGRNSQRYTFALAYRLAEPVAVRPDQPERHGEFQGVVFAALELSYFQEICSQSRNFQSLDVLLVTADDKVLTSCRSADLSATAPVAGKALSVVLLNLGLPDTTANILHSTGAHEAGDWLLHAVAVPGPGDLRLVSLQPAQEWLADWLLLRNWLLGLLLVILPPGLWFWFRHQRLLPELATLSALESGHHEFVLKQQAYETEVASLRQGKQQADQVKSTFLASISHDLRQPLTGIRLSLNVLPHYILQGQQQRALEVIRNLNDAALQLQAQFDCMLDYARSESDELRPNFKLVEVGEIFQRLEHSYRYSAQLKGLKLRFRSRHYFLLTDPLLLTRLLGNLLQNAITYTEQGGILVTARQQGKEVRLEVFDTGIGIPEQEQLRIFDTFYQVGNKAREASPHVGLGLSIVRNLTLALGGSLGIRSLPGRGSCFSLRLRLDAVQPLPDAPAPQPILFILPLPARLRAYRAQALAAVDQEKRVKNAASPMPVTAMLSPATGSAQEPVPVIPHETLAAAAQTPVLPLHVLIAAAGDAAIVEKLVQLMQQWQYGYTVLDAATPAPLLANQLASLRQAGARPVLLLPDAAACLAPLPPDLPLILWYQDEVPPNLAALQAAAEARCLPLPLRPARLRALLSSAWAQGRVATTDETLAN